MNKTVYDEGLEQGRLRLIEASLREKFGSLSEHARARLQQMSETDLVQLNLKIGTADSLADLGLDESE